MDDVVKSAGHFFRPAFFPGSAFHLVDDAVIDQGLGLDEGIRDHPDVIEVVVPTGMLAKSAQVEAGRIRHGPPILVQEFFGKIVHDRSGGYSGRTAGWAAADQPRGGAASSKALTVLRNSLRR